MNHRLQSRKPLALSLMVCLLAPGLALAQAAPDKAQFDVLEVAAYVAEKLRIAAAFAGGFGLWQSAKKRRELGERDLLRGADQQIVKQDHLHP